MSGKSSLSAENDVVTCITVEIDIRSWPTGWNAGPLELAIPNSNTRGSRPGKSHTTDRAARATMFARRVQDLLLGTEEDPGATRVHFGGPPAVRSGIWTLEAVELVRRPALFGGQGDATGVILVSHWSGAPLAVAEALHSLLGDMQDTRPREEADTDFWRSLGDLGIEMMGEPERFRTLTHVIEPPAAVGVPNSPPHLAEYPELWAIAAGTPASIAAPATLEPDSIIRPSAQWGGLVLRDGAAFSSPFDGASAFHEYARIYCRSIYLDAMVLGILQLGCASALADRSQTLMVSAPTLRTLNEERKALLHFRGSIWWSHVTNRATV
ncbi:MAG: hypothetical protein JWQ43_550, partial [Glaciihabitans sp.]|nr:hypothetical protein [Glaciihabitans sp.]